MIDQRNQNKPPKNFEKKGEPNIQEGQLEERVPKPLPRMAAGVFGYIGYDNIKLIENIPQKLEKNEVLPDSLLIRPSLIIIFDNLNR